MINSFKLFVKPISLRDFLSIDVRTVTPTIFGGTDREGDSEDVFGAVVQTVFKF